MRNKKNIAIIIPSLNGGGAERTASNISIFLSKEYNVHLIVFDGRYVKYPYSGTLHDLKMPPNGSMFGKIWNVAKRTLQVRKIKKHERIDVSISLMDGPNLVNVFSRCNEKIITSVRIFMSKSRRRHGKISIYQKLKMNLIGEFSDKIVTLSKGVEDDLVSSFGISRTKLLTIYNPCSAELLLKKSSIDLLDKYKISHHSVATMGRMTNQKGQWLLIRAFAEVVKRIANAKLFVLGEGPLESELKNLVKQLNLEKNVCFCGFVEAPHQIIRKCRIFVFPSLFEGLGNVLIEAMACGIPCISCDCLSGPREVLAPNTKYVGSLNMPEYGQYGILVKVSDSTKFDAGMPLNETEHQLAWTMIDMMTNDEMWQRYHQASLSRSADFGYNLIMQNWTNLIEKL